MSLVCIGIGVAGLLLVLPAAAVLIVAAPLLLGFVQGVVTPATSQVVSRFTAARTAGIIMAIRQSAIPTGSMLAGLVMPILAIYWGWHDALLVLAAVSAGLAIILLPAVRWLNYADSTPLPAQRPLEPVKRLLAMSGMRQILFAIVISLMVGGSVRGRFLRSIWSKIWASFSPLRDWLTAPDNWAA